MTDKPRLSISRMEKLLKCGQAYYYEYVQGMPNPAGISMIVGINVHHVARQDLAHKMENGLLLPDDFVIDAALTNMKDLVQNTEIKLKEDEAYYGLDKIVGEATDDSVRLSQTHHAGLAITIKPTAVEREFNLVLPYSHDLQGSIDVCEDGMVRDLKTTKVKPTEHTAEASRQLSGYALAVITIDATEPPAVALDHLVYKKKGVETITFTSTRTWNDLRNFLILVERVIKQIDSGIFLPAPTNCWWCGKDWCNYWDICPYGRRGVFAA